MEKFTKIFFYFFLPIILVMMVLSYPKSNNRAGAYTSNIENIVTFIGANNQPIYSLNVPLGVTLNDIQNANLISNSGFLGLQDVTITAQGQTGLDGNAYRWFIQKNNILPLTLNFGSDGGVGVDFLNSDTDTYVYLKYNFKSMFEPDTLYYVNLSLNGVKYSATYRSRSDLSGSYSADVVLSSILLGGVFVRFEYITDGSYLWWNIGTSSGVSFYLDYFSVNKVGYNSFFDIDYLNALYTYSGGSISSDKSWSTDTQGINNFNFNDDIVYRDINLYYTTTKYYFNFGDDYSTILGNLDKNRPLTNQALDNLKKQYNKFISSMDINDTNFVTAIGSAVINIFEATYYLFVIVGSVAYMAVCPLIDMFNYYTSLTDFNINFWNVS